MSQEWSDIGGGKHVLIGARPIATRGPDHRHDNRRILKPVHFYVYVRGYPRTIGTYIGGTTEELNDLEARMTPEEYQDLKDQGVIAGDWSPQGSWEVERAEAERVEVADRARDDERARIRRAKVKQRERARVESESKARAIREGSSKARNIRLLVKRHLRRFRLRLADAVAERAARLRVAPPAWKQDIDQWQEWRDRCRARICPDCGYRWSHSWVYMQGNCGSQGEWKRQPACGCDSEASDAHLVSWLRRLAGLNGGHATVRHEWSNALEGRPGPRGCSQASWESAVRAFEEAGDDAA